MQPTLFRSQYYESLSKQNDELLKKASKSLDEQEEHNRIVTKAVNQQELLNFQLRDATTSLFKTYHELKKKNNDYRRYVSLLEQQQKLLTLRLGKLSQRNLNCEQKTASEILLASDKRNDIVEEIRQLRQKNVNFEKRMAQDYSKNESLQNQIQSQNDATEKLLQNNQELSLENKKLRNILRMEEEVSKLAEKVENRRLDQLSLVDPVYADYLRRRWAVEGNRNLYDWEVAKFGNLFPPFLDPKLKSSEESRHLMDRITLVELKAQNSDSFHTNRGKENTKQSNGFDITKSSRTNSIAKLSSTSSTLRD